MKKLLLLLSCFISLQLSAQPDLQKSIFIAEKHCWYNEFLAGYYDMTYVPTVDLFAVAFRANRLSANSGPDLVLYRIDANTYDTLWSKAYGGSRVEDNTDVHINALPNGNLLLSGTTFSYDMDFVSNPLQSGLAAFFLEVDTAGSIVRTKLLNGSGGVNSTTLRDVEVDAQGNIYGTGSTNYNTLDFAHTSLSKDGYVVKLDSNLNKEWMRFWVGYDSDEPAGLGIIQGGNIAVTGVTSDTGTTAMLSHLDQGKGDLYIEAYNPQGVTLWKNRLSGKEKEAGRDVVYAPNSNEIYVIGETYSANGDIGYHTAKANTSDTNRLENSNLWIIRLDTLGNMLHSKAYGSRSYGIYNQRATYFEDAIWYQGQLWVVGRTSGGGGDIDTNILFGGDNVWISTYNNDANLTSKYTMNGVGTEDLTNLFIKNGILYALGTSRTGGGLPNNFSCDSTDDIEFLTRLAQAPLSVNTVEGKKTSQLFKLYPNPGSDQLNIELIEKANSEKHRLIITDAKGNVLKRKRLRKKINNIHCSPWPSGIYYIQVQSANTRQTKKFIKQ